MKLKVYATATASATLDITLTDAELEEIATELETTVDKLTIEDVTDKASEKAFNEGFPGICAQCSGWRQRYSMDIGEWEPEETEHVTLITE